MELISDSSVLELFEAQMGGGGVSTVFHRCSEANNKYLDYDSAKPSSYITYLDALPTGNFRFLKAPQILKIFIAVCNK